MYLGYVSAVRILFLLLPNLSGQAASDIAIGSDNYTMVPGRGSAHGGRGKDQAWGRHSINTSKGVNKCCKAHPDR